MKNIIWILIIGLFLAGSIWDTHRTAKKINEENSRRYGNVMDQLSQAQERALAENQQAMQGYTTALMDNFRAIVDGYDKLKCEVAQQKRTNRANVKVLKDKDAELMKTVESYSLDNETKFETLLNALIDKDVCCPPPPEKEIIYQYYPFEVEKEVIRYIDNTDTKVEYLWNSRTIIEHDKCETPEPMTALMLGGGLVGLGIWRKR